jgi:hypothetical protein
MQITVKYEQMKMELTVHFEVEKSSLSLESLQKLIYEHIRPESHSPKLWKYTVIKAKDAKITDDETLQKVLSLSGTPLFNTVFNVNGHP